MPGGRAEQGPGQVADTHALQLLAVRETHHPREAVGTSPVRHSISPPSFFGAAVIVPRETPEPRDRASLPAPHPFRVQGV